MKQPNNLKRFENYLKWLKKIKSVHYAHIYNNDDNYVNLMNAKYPMK